MKERIIMATKTVTGGYASDYGDQILWIERAEEGADAALIVDESEFTPCKITKVIDHNDYGSEEDYSDACDELMDESTAAATGEFVTADGIFYVELDATADTESFDAVDFDDVDFC